MRKFVHVSASQIDTYLDCNRMWWFTKILGLTKPTHASAALGGRVHKILESYLLDGTLPDKKTLEGRIAHSGIEHLPEPGSVQVEWSIDKNPISGFKLGGLPIKGFIDVFDPDQPDPLIIDHKTTSDMKWAKDKRQLATNVQLTIYAQYAVLLTQQRRGVVPNKVKAGHVVYLTRGAMRSRKTMVEMTREGIEERWEALDDIVYLMRQDALVKLPGDVRANTSSCDKYGGCAFREKCRLLGTISAPEIPSFILKARNAQRNALTPKETPTMSENPALAALNRLRLGGKVNNVPAVAPAPAPAADKAAPDPVLDPISALRALSASGAAKDVLGDTQDLGTEPEKPATAPADAGEKPAGVASILLKFGLANAGANNTVVPPDAARNTPTDSAVKAASVEKEQTAPAAEAEEAPPVKTARRPSGYRKKLEALSYTEQMVDKMTPVRMREIIDGEIQAAVTDSPGHSDEVEQALNRADSEFLSELNSATKAQDAAWDKDANGVGPATPSTPEEMLEKVDSLAVREETAPVPGLVVYVDCIPVKGRETQNVTLLEELVRPYMAEAAKMNAVTHYGLIEYGKGPQYVAAFVLANPPQGIILANTRYPATGALLEVLLPMADVVVRAAR